MILDVSLDYIMSHTLRPSSSFIHKFFALRVNIFQNETFWLILELETKSHSLMKKLSNEVHFRNIMSCHELWSWLTKLASHALLINMHHTFIKLHEVRTTCLFWNAPLLPPSSTKFKAVSSSLNFSLIIIIPLLSNLTNIPMHGVEKLKNCYP